MIVHALIGAPAVLALESPLAGLDAWSQNWVLEAVLRAADGRRLLTSIAAVDESGPERNLLDRATELLWLDGGRIGTQGPPSTALGSSKRYLVTALAHGAELAEALERRGCGVHDALAAGAPSAVLIAAGATRFIVELPDELTPDVVLGCAVDVEAPVVELVPFGNAMRNGRAQ
jgi:ABC-type multidrug transport system ATPase subunit